MKMKFIIGCLVLVVLFLGIIISSNAQSDWKTKSYEEKERLIDSTFNIDNSDNRNLTQIINDLFYLTECYIFEEENEQIENQIEFGLVNNYIYFGSNLDYYFDKLRELYNDKVSVLNENELYKFYKIQLLGKSSILNFNLSIELPENSSECAKENTDVADLIINFTMDENFLLTCIDKEATFNSHFIRLFSESGSFRGYFLQSLSNESLINFYMIIARDNRLNKELSFLKSELRSRLKGK